MAYNLLLHPERPANPMGLMGGEVTGVKKGTSADLTFGYVGCETKGEYFSLVTSPTFSPSYVYYRKAQENPRFSTKKSAILDAISWLHGKLDDGGNRDPIKCVILDEDGDEDDSQSAIPYTLDAAWQMYESNKESAHKFLGCLVYITDEILQNAASHGETLSAEDVETRYNDLSDCGIKVLEKNREHSNAAPLALPFGLRAECTRKYDEKRCERWNRIWLCMQQLDFYKPNTKAPLLFANVTKSVDPKTKPRWWEEKAEGNGKTPSASTLIKEAIALVVQPNTTKYLMCSLVLDPDDPDEDVKDYLDEMQERYSDEVAKVRQPQKIFSPYSFPSIYRWVSFVSRRMNFGKLRVVVKELKMSLLNENGTELGKTHVIYGSDTGIQISEMKEIIDTVKPHDIRFYFGLITDESSNEPEYELPSCLQSFMKLENDAFVPAHFPTQLKTAQTDGVEIFNNPTTAASQTSSGIVPRLVQGCIEEGPPLPPVAPPRNDEQSNTALPSNDIPLSEPPAMSRAPKTFDWNTYRPEHAASMSDAARAWDDIEREAMEGGYKPALDPETSDLMFEQGWPIGPAPNEPIRSKISQYTASVQKSKAGTKWTTHAAVMKKDLADLTRMAGTEVKLDPFEPFVKKFECAFDACKEEAEAYPFTQPKPKGMSGLTQFYAPSDVWLRDRLGPNDTRRERSQFIDEEYDGLDVLDDKSKLMEWIRMAINEVAPGRVATQRPLDDRTKKSKVYKNVARTERAVGNMEVSDAMRFDRPMKDGVKGASIEGEDLEYVS
jgi:hypothetical protein